MSTTASTVPHARREGSAATIAADLLEEFERELVTTRRFLEAIPDTPQSLTWRPHPKSMTTGQLALHIAQIPLGVTQLGLQDEAPAPDFGAQPQPKSLREALEALDQGAAFVRRTLPTITDQRMGETWRLSKDGRPIMSMPRAVFFRSVLLNHWYHHRGQLGVHLRLLGARVPSSYGPSGDEG